MPVSLASRSNLHACPSAEALNLLGVDPKQGLTTSEARTRQHLYGKNELSRQKRRHWLGLLLSQFRSIIVWFLGLAAAVSLFTGDIAEAIAIFCVLAINTAIGFSTSLSATRSMEALFRMTAITARVRRDGHSVMLPVAELVPGDVVVLEGGDVVPADMRLLTSADLRCNESALTGESAPVMKTIEPLPEDTLTADRSNIALKGTAVTRGAGVGIVALIGSETELGRIATMAQSAAPAQQPLERRLDKLGAALIWITLALAMLIALAGYLRGLELVDMIEVAIALAVAAIPEGLPVVATLALARGMLRLASHNALIEHLSAAETLGATTMILTDKTGTLTANQMTVTGYLLDGREVDFDNWVAPDDKILRRALDIGALCNTAELTGDGAEGIGDPMELALLHAATAAGQPPNREAPSTVHPYDPAARMMATDHSDNGAPFTAVKGAPEAVLERADHLLTLDGEKPLTKAAREGWTRRVDAAARRGFRLIGLAYRDSHAPHGAHFDGLTLVGFVCLLDPLRDDVIEAVAETQAAGVRVAMVTGDHIATATEIARQVGLANGGDPNALSERDLTGLHQGTIGAGLRAQLDSADVFARVSPQTKLRLVEYYQNEGHIVAMTGDGVNDAPALRKADIGVAMGQRGTQVARDAADMVLKDDAFSSITAAMRQGRVIFNNIRRFVIYLMSCNLSEILVVGLAISAGLPTPLVPLQILFLNIVTDVFPAFALGLGEGDGRVMRRPPRDPKEPVVRRDDWLDIVVFGGIITLATLCAFWVALDYLVLPTRDATTVAFLTLALAQLLHVFTMRARNEGLLVNSVTRNPWVWAALVLCLALLGLAMTVPVFSQVLSLSVSDWRLIVLPMGAAAGSLLLGQLWVAITH